MSGDIKSTSPQWPLGTRYAETYSSSLQNKDEIKRFFRTRQNVSKRLRATHQTKELCCSMSYQFALELQSLPNQHSSTSGCLHHRQWHISMNILCQCRHSDTHTAVIRFLLNQYQTEGCFIASAFHVCSRTLPYKRPVIRTHSDGITRFATGL